MLPPEYLTVSVNISKKDNVHGVGWKILGREVSMQMTVRMLGSMIREDKDLRAGTHWLVHEYVKKELGKE